VFGAIAMLIAIGSAVAAPPPSLSSSITGSDRQLTPSQRSEMRAYVEYWTDALGSGNPDEVTRARGELIRHVQSPGVGGGFRPEYANDIITRLKPVIAGPDDFRAVNGIQVIGLLGTTRGIDLLLEHVSVTHEARAQVRVIAARGLKEALRDETLPPAKLLSTAREIGRAIEEETDWNALYRQFEAIASVEDQATPTVREEALGIYRTTLEAAIARMEKEPPSRLMHGVRRALIDLRKLVINQLNVDGQRRLGRLITPTLDRLLKLATSHWEDAQASDAVRMDYGGVIEEIELLLVTFASAGGVGEQPQDDALRVSWRDSDKPRFETTRRQSMQVLR
jgi:hypothetical protein